jgi:pilus assembly protein CpaB
MDKDKNSSLPNQIPPGYRALTLQVRADTNVAGFVLPDARVDVVFTQRAGEKDSISKTILQNMRVLAVDTKDTRQEGEKAMPANTVTLLVKPEEAEVLTMARTLGELSLILRGFDDAEAINTPARSRTTSSSWPAPPPPPATAPRTARARRCCPAASRTSRRTRRRPPTRSRNRRRRRPPRRRTP